MTGYYRSLPDDPRERDELLLKAVELGDVVYELVPVTITLDGVDYSWLATRSGVEFGQPGNSVRVGMTAVGQVELLKRLGLRMHTPLSCEATMLSALNSGGLVPPQTRTYAGRDSMSTEAMVEQHDAIAERLQCGYRGVVHSWKSRVVIPDERNGYFAHEGWGWRKGRPGAPAPLHPAKYATDELMVIQNLESAHSATAFADYATPVDGVLDDGQPAAGWPPSYAKPATAYVPEQVKPKRTAPGDKGAEVETWQKFLIMWFRRYQSEDALPKYGADKDHGKETEFWSNRYESLTESADTVSEPMRHQLPEISFKQAVSYHQGRRRPLNKIVIHTAEIAETLNSAENLQTWAASGPIGVSWHFSVDADSVCQSVHVTDTAWAAPGANSDGIQIELAGYAKQNSGDWADDYSGSVLDLAARLCAKLCLEHDIPARKISMLELQSGDGGICGHYDVTMAFKRSTHMDPGPRFPWKSFIDSVNGYM
jgi:N-acetyl-anhydromuramyl-L-alanine amidase AmpD